MEGGYGTVKPNGYEMTGSSSQTDSDTDLIDRQKKKLKSSNGYPYSVIFILSNEFCERFSYYGMRAILVLYLTRWLGFEENKATSIFHAFSMLCYSMPLIGAVIADGYLGRYRTILYLSCVYFVGNLILALTALPPPEWIGPAIGLFLIACGTGGIKASVAPFGADQFLPGQEKWQNSFFSAFYFMINLGSMISILLTPILRADVQCFDNDCYILAFGVPAVLMFLSILLFLLGKHQYQKVPPTGNIVGKTFKCIYYGAIGKLRRNKYEEPRSHWLYYADDKFDDGFIEDVRRLLRVLLMFVPLPLFWALSDQQGSRWTLQAEHMDGDLGVFGTLKPDQMQGLNPLLILALIPLFDKVIYPLVDKCRVPNKPLQRMVVGLYISAAAFICAGLVQLKIDNAEEMSLSSGETGVTFLNTLPCNIQIKSPLYTGSVNSYKMSNFVVANSGNYSVGAEATCSKSTLKFKKSFLFSDLEAYRMIAYIDAFGKLEVGQFKDQRNKPRQGNAALSIFTTDVLADSYTVVSSSTKTKVVTENIGTHFNVTPFQVTEFKDLVPLHYKIYEMNEKSVLVDIHADVKLGTGGVYTAYIYNDGTKSGVVLYVDVNENTVSMLWMIPQYVLITVGEVLFSISGLSFAYSQAPTSLKSVVQAIWLLTVSFGDLMVIIVANIHSIPSQMVEFFIFAALMFVDTVIFMVMSMFYTYKPNSLNYQVLGEEPVEINIAPAPESSESEEHALQNMTPTHSDG